MAELGLSNMIRCTVYAKKKETLETSSIQEKPGSNFCFIYLVQITAEKASNDD